VGAGAELLDDPGKALGERIRLLGGQLDEPVADEGSRPPGGAEVPRDQVPPRLLVAREEQPQHPRRDGAALEVVIRRDEDERVGAPPPAFTTGAELGVLDDRARPSEHPQVVARRAARLAEPPREDGRGRRPLDEQPEDLEPQRVGHRPHLDTGGSRSAIAKNLCNR
jgi:hypothetical protein